MGKMPPELETERSPESERVYVWDGEWGIPRHFLFLPSCLCQYLPLFKPSRKTIVKETWEIVCKEREKNGSENKTANDRCLRERRVWRTFQNS